MTANEFQRSTTLDLPPSELSLVLQALWWDAKGDWARAHALIDELETRDGMAVHAYLHRKEGDASNAQYWYNRAQRPFCPLSLDEEWKTLVEELLR
jgi:hypothetical protein